MDKTFETKRLPHTVDEAVDLLLTDLPVAEQDTLRSLNDKDFSILYQSVAESIINEFGLWAGNDELLASCLSAAPASDRQHEPSLIILEHLRKRLRDAGDIFILI